MKRSISRSALVAQAKKKMTQRPAIFAVVAMLMLAVLFITVKHNGRSAQGNATPVSTKKPLTIANYELFFSPKYESWTPRNRREDPLIGHYDALDPRVLEQHIEWCISNGIEALAIQMHFQNYQEFLVALKAASNINKIKVVITLDSIGTQITMKQSGHIKPKTKDDPLWMDFTNPTVPPALAWFMQNIERLYFDEPWYLRIDNRPAMIFALSRTWIGNATKAIHMLKGFSSQSLFAIGDNVFWGQTPESNGLGPHNNIRKKTPFDAYTGINMYSVGTPDHELSPQGEMIDKFFELSKYPELARKWSNNTHYAPTIMPRFGSFVKEHPVLYGTAETFKEALLFARRLSQPVFDSVYDGIYIIHSFNNYLEGHCIEPTEQFGFAYLDVIREVFAPNLPRPANSEEQTVQAWADIGSYRGMMIANRVEHRKTAYHGTLLDLSDVGALNPIPNIIHHVEEEDETPTCPPLEH